MFDVFSIGSKRLTQKAVIWIHASVNQNEFTKRVREKSEATKERRFEWIVSCVLSATAVRELSSEKRNWQSVSFQHPNLTTKIPEFIYHFSGFSALRYKRIKLRQMTIVKDDMESSSTKRLMKWKQRPNPKSECDQSICYGSWLFIALGHLNPFPICDLRAIVLKRNVQSQWTN